MSVPPDKFSSVQNAFISTIDHLPCDVIRSLWLIQYCNIKVNNLQADLDKILSDMQQDQEASATDAARNNRINDILKEILWYTRESVQEAGALKNQLVTHRISLAEELALLQQIAGTGDKNIDEKIDPVKLRTQLREHYAQNPLPSRGEALKAMENIAASQKHRPQKAGHLSGIKLVLKLRPPNSKKEKKVGIKPSIKKPKEVDVVKVPQATQDMQEDHELYCFCRQESFGDMIACDNNQCPNGEWFHYRCVGLRNRVEALKFTTGKRAWFCLDECRSVPNNSNKKVPKPRKQVNTNIATSKTSSRRSLRRR